MMNSKMVEVADRSGWPDYAVSVNRKEAMNNDTRPS